MLHIRPKDIAGLLYNEGGIPRGSVGDIRIFLKHSLVDVSQEVAPILLKRLATCSLCGYEVNLREDRAGQEDTPRARLLERRSCTRPATGKCPPRSYSRPRRTEYDSTGKVLYSKFSDRRKRS